MPVKQIKTFKIEGADLKALIKQLDETGEGTAQIAVIGVKDHDGDIAEPGAFGTGQWAHFLPTHNWGSVPLGKALIREDGVKVLADFKLNLEIPKAKEWRSALKFDLEHGEPIQEWSYGLKVLRHEMGVDGSGDRVRNMKEIEVIEISPVVRGAGTDTGTVAVKALGDESFVTTPTTDEPWSKADNVGRFKGDDVGTLHHVINAEGEPGAASVKACINKIAVLNGERAGAVVDPAAKQAVYDHLAAHLKDAGIDAPALDLKARSGLKFADEVEVAIQAVYDTQDILTGLKARIDGLKATRAGDGRELSAVKLAEVNSVIEAVKGMSLLEIAPAQDPAITEKAASAFAVTEFLGVDNSG